MFNQITFIFLFVIYIIIHIIKDPNFTDELTNSLIKYKDLFSRTRSKNMFWTEAGSPLCYNAIFFPTTLRKHLGSEVVEALFPLRYFAFIIQSHLKNLKSFILPLTGKHFYRLPESFNTSIHCRW